MCVLLVHVFPVCLDAGLLCSAVAVAGDMQGAQDIVRCVLYPPGLAVAFMCGWAHVQDCAQRPSRKSPPLTLPLVLLLLLPMLAGAGVAGGGPAAGSSCPHLYQLKPTWRLLPGHCFESLAFSVARDCGLPQGVLRASEDYYSMIMQVRT
jgi:hypothetical protein